MVAMIGHRVLTPAVDRLLAIVACVAGISYYLLTAPGPLQKTMRGENDFLSFYTGGRLAFTGELYNINANLAVHRSVIDGESRALVFCRLPFYAALMWPLSRFPYRLALTIWEILLIAGTGYFVYIFPWAARSRTAMACCWSLPLVVSLFIGQDVILYILAVVAAWRFACDNRDFCAGCALALCSIKPHFCLLFPLVIVAQRRWRMGAGLITGGAVLAAVSFTAGGWNWVPEFLSAALSRDVTPESTFMLTTFGLAEATGIREWVLSGAAVVIALIAVFRGTFLYGFACVLIATLLIAHHGFLSDAAMLLPAFLFLANYSRYEWQRVVALGYCTPLVYMYALSADTINVTRIALFAFLVSCAFGGAHEKRAEEDHRNTVMNKASAADAQRD
jgi:hypothetical protein